MTIVPYLLEKYWGFLMMLSLSFSFVNLIWWREHNSLQQKIVFEDLLQSLICIRTQNSILFRWYYAFILLRSNLVVRGKTRPFAEQPHSAGELLRTPKTMPASMATYLLSSWGSIFNGFHWPLWHQTQDYSIGSSHSASAAYQQWPTIHELKTYRNNSEAIHYIHHYLF